MKEEYVIKALVRLRVKNAEDASEAGDLACEFFHQGLNSLAYSDDPDDDHYEIDDVTIYWDD